MLKFGVFLAALLAVSEAESIRGKLSNSILLAVRDTACKARFSCYDCNTTRICKPNDKGGFDQVTTIKCPAATPYCDETSGTCTAQVDAGRCGTEDPSFICMEDGYFPHSADCRSYYYCSGFKALKYQCIIAGENYDPVQQKCVKTATCDKLACIQAGIKQPFLDYPQYFGYCGAPAQPPTVIDRCAGDYHLNVTSQTCEPICKTEGVVKDEGDCTKYYKCHNIWVPDGKNQWNLVMIRDHLSCPPDNAFDSDQFMCVDINKTSCKHNEF